MSSVTAPRTSPATLLGALLAALLALVLAPLLALVVLVGSFSGSAGGPVDDIPAEYLLLYRAADARYGVDWAILAAIGKIETDHGRSNAAGVKSGVNFAGCCAGPMQFSILPRPSTWDMFGASGDVYAPEDAIPAAARYLRASGAPADYRRAIFTYNHSTAYVAQVLAQAQEYRAAGDQPGSGTDVPTGGGPWLASVPGFPGEQCDRRILPDVAYLLHKYRLRVTDCFSLDPVHETTGEHPLGLATDLVPGPGGTWDDVDRLAAWAEPTQDHPRDPFRWVGYNGDRNHGRGLHLHLSWQHGPGRPAETVRVFSR